MAESLITNTELSNYFTSLDKTDVEIRRILAGIQMLHPQTMNSLMYYLVNGIIDITLFSDREVNNWTADAAIRDAELTSDTIVNRLEFYRKNLKGLQGYKDFLDTSVLDNGNRVSKFLIAKREIVAFIDIDIFGNRPGSFKSVLEVMRQYDSLIDDQEVRDFIDLLDIKSTSISSTIPNFKILHDIIIKRINNYVFLEAENGEIVTNMTTDCIVGMVTRGIFDDLYFRNYINDVTGILKHQGVMYDDDIPKDGVYSINKLLATEEYDWNKTFPVNSDRFDAVETLNAIGKTMLLRHQFVTKFYGSPYFSNATILAETQIVNEMSLYFRLARELCIIVLKKCKLQFEGVEYVEYNYY